MFGINIVHYKYRTKIVSLITYQDEDGTVDEKNVQGEMSKDEVGNVQGIPEFMDDELELPLEPYERQAAKDKRKKYNKK